MQIVEFRENLEVYSSDLGRWPENLRQEAEKLMESSDEAKDIFISAVKDDQVIDPDHNAPPEGLLNSIMRNIGQKKK